MELKEVFEVIKNANNSGAIYTTHDRGIADAEREHILRVLKAKWPQEAATLDTKVPEFIFQDDSSKL
jgi:hypothetical protein